MNFVISLGSERHLQRLLEKSSIDLAIGSLTDIPSSEVPLVIEPISTERILLVAHKKYGLVPEEEQEHNSPDNPYLLDPEKLQNLPFIAPPPATGMYRTFQRMIGLYGIHPKSSIVIDMMTTGLRLTQEGTWRPIYFCRNPHFHFLHWNDRMLWITVYYQIYLTPAHVPLPGVKKPNFFHSFMRP